MEMLMWREILSISYKTYLEMLAKATPKSGSHLIHPILRVILMCGTIGNLIPAISWHQELLSEPVMLTEIGLHFLMSNNIPLVAPIVSGPFRRDHLGQGLIMLGRRLIQSTTQFIDQRAELKLEGNIEYRFDIIKMFKGAVFLDGGNIWLLKQVSRTTEGYRGGRKFQC